MTRFLRPLRRAARRVLIGPPTPAASRWGRVGYGQHGEDLVLHGLLGEAAKAPGFYVDVGAHHPERFSNTKLFYDAGWRGLNVDPRPGMKATFDAARPRDVNVEAAVAAEAGTRTFHMFKEPALSTMDPAVLAKAEANAHLPGYERVGDKRVEALPLRDLLARHVPAGQEVGFLTVDVEGLDEEVLRSHDWEAVRPRFVAAEIWGHWLRQSLDAPLVDYLRGVGYELRARTAITAFFEDARRPDAGPPPGADPGPSPGEGANPGRSAAA